jgi:hypothetical protein
VGRENEGGGNGACLESGTGSPAPPDVERINLIDTEDFPLPLQFFVERVEDVPPAV